MQTTEVTVSLKAWDGIKLIANQLGRLRHAEIVQQVLDVYLGRLGKWQGLDAFGEPAPLTSGDTRTIEVTIDTLGAIRKELIPRMIQRGWLGREDDVGHALSEMIVGFVDLLFAEYFDSRQRKQREKFQRQLASFTRHWRERTQCSRDT